MCLYPGIELGPNCGQFFFVVRGMKQVEKDIILDLHNSFRAIIANGKGDGSFNGKPAANMFELVWHDELATIAQRWANQCIIDHDIQRGIRNVDEEDFEVGQNINSHWIPSGRPPPEGPDYREEEFLRALFQPWADEIKLYNMSVPYSTQQMFSQGYDTSNFTQLVWADTMYMGCGYVFGAKSEESVLGKILVCNYGPAGNISGKDLYYVGPPCNGCPLTRCSTKYPELCSHVSSFSKN